MRLTSILTFMLFPLVMSSPISHENTFSLISLENIETHIDNLWTKFKEGYGLIYNTTVEEMHRFQIFAGHVKMIAQHNLEHDLGLHTYRLGVNRFATLVNMM
jgi:hypothetical protein